jgi:hypothetical protein
MATDDITMTLNREEWGVIVDGLMREMDDARKRKTMNPHSTSDIRFGMCSDLIQRINQEAQ